MRSSACIIRTAFAVLCLYDVALHAASFPDPAVDNKNPIRDLLKGDQTAFLAGGCFWCVEAVFRQIAGVDQVVSGYTGGDAATAHYDMVSTGKTGHVESVKITYNPRKVSYGQLLKLFFEESSYPTEAGWLFANPRTAKPYHQEEVQKKHIRPAAKAAGIKGTIGWKSFRHSYRSWLDQTEAPVGVQRELMRHASIQSTMNVYGRAMTDSKRQAHDKVVQMVLKTGNQEPIAKVV